MQRILARVAWIVPIGLFGLAANQADVATDVRNTLRTGSPAVALVTDFEKIDRADVTYGYVSLEVDLGEDGLISRERMSLPYSLLPRVQGRETLDVRVVPGADQNIVIDLIAETQWKIAAIQAAISLAGALLALTGVLGWNRMLRRRGDPASSTPM